MVHESSPVGGYSVNVPGMPGTLTAALHREEDWYIAQCLEVEVASQGHTIDEALANLAEAVELYLKEWMIRPSPAAPSCRARAAPDSGGAAVTAFKPIQARARSALVGERQLAP